MNYNTENAAKHCAFNTGICVFCLLLIMVALSLSTTAHRAFANESAAPQEGIYTISSVLDGGMYVNIAAASSSDEARAELYSENNTPAQRFRIAPCGDGYYTIKNVLSGKVLDVQWGANASGTPVQQYEPNGSYAQQWRFEVTSSGAYTVVSRLIADDGKALVLDVPSADMFPGAGLQVYEENGTDAQYWTMFSIVPAVADGTYSFASALGADLVLDVSCGSTESGANVQIYTPNASAAQYFYLSYDASMGYYTVKNSTSGNMLDISCASTINATNVQMYSDNNTLAQKWHVSANENGTYTFVSALGDIALDVDCARAEAATNVQVWETNGTAAQQWTLVQNMQEPQSGTFTIASAYSPTLCLDVSAGELRDGANVQLYTINKSASQTFVISEPDAQGYRRIILEKTGKLLSASTNSSEANNVGILSPENVGAADNQLWMITEAGIGLSIINKATGGALDISSALYANETNIQTYPSNASAAQRFVLIPRSSTPHVGVFAYVGENRVDESVIDGTEYVFLPSNADLTSLKLGYTAADSTWSAAVASSASGPFSAISGDAIDLTSLGISADATECTLYVKVSPAENVSRLVIMRSKAIASMYLTSENALDGGRNYIEGSIDHSTKASVSALLVTSEGSVVNASSNQQSAQIKGRGNSTWTASAKKPYQLKFDKKVDMLQNGEDAKTWLLLANAIEPTLLHDTIAYNLALEMGIYGSTNCKPVDVYYEGEYRGSYLLCEKVQVGTNRVDITDLDDKNEDANPGIDVETQPLSQAINSFGYTYQYVSGIASPSDISGGYLLELDTTYYQDERSWFNTSIGAFVLKSPENATKEEVLYASERMQEALNALADNNGINHDTGASIADYFDIDSLAKIYILNEYTKNVDYWQSSTYFYIPSTYDAAQAEIVPRIYSGPAWDFDIAFGTHNEEGSDPEGLLSSINGFECHGQTLRSYVVDYYMNSFEPTIQKILFGDEQAQGTFLHSMAYYVSEVACSQAMNQVLWGFAYHDWIVEPYDTWEENLNYLKDFLQRRLTWLHGEFSSW